MRAGFLQLSKSFSSSSDQKKNVLRVHFGKFVYDEEQKQFSKQKCWKCS